MKKEEDQDVNGGEDEDDENWSIEGQQGSTSYLGFIQENSFLALSLMSNLASTEFNIDKFFSDMSDVTVREWLGKISSTTDGKFNQNELKKVCYPCIFLWPI